jgi:hypothetical protein
MVIALAGICSLGDEARARPAPNSDGEKIADPAIIASQQIRRTAAFVRFILFSFEI